ncbi:MAG: ATP phosphoribosyltransferase [Chloroflexi bacterium]|nr:ATP phosphoribosyltransferase [Chloroflexota bacterium]
MEIRFALPKGKILSQTQSLIERAGLGLDGYAEGSRHYRIGSTSLSGLQAKIFQERDIPIQVAIGNYDLGICGCQWVEELLSGYPLSDLVRICDLGYGRGTLHSAASRFSEYRSERDLSRHGGLLRIVSEYPNMAESLALRLRLRRFKVFPLWGSAEAYPPENSDICLVWREGKPDLDGDGLVSLSEVLHGGACLIANKVSWQRHDLGDVVGRLCRAVIPMEENTIQSAGPRRLSAPAPAGQEVWLALPDGHQQAHASKLLDKAGIAVEGYSGKSRNRCPGSNLPGVRIKIVRPQDMPMHVANGNFDLAITGKDWLSDHKLRFPSSPVEELLDLGFGKVRIVAVVDGAERVQDMAQLRTWMATKGTALRIASEYTNIADKFARDNHLVPYKVIPTWGATEAFIPEDADLLIENTETGRTLAEHNLHVVDTIAVSTGCVIGNTEAIRTEEKQPVVARVIEQIRRGLPS